MYLKQKKSSNIIKLKFYDSKWSQLMPILPEQIFKASRQTQPVINQPQSCEGKAGLEKTMAHYNTQTKNNPNGRLWNISKPSRCIQSSSACSQQSRRQELGPADSRQNTRTQWPAIRGGPSDMDSQSKDNCQQTIPNRRLTRINMHQIHLKLAKYMNPQIVWCQKKTLMLTLETLSRPWRNHS